MNTKSILVFCILEDIYPATRVETNLCRNKCSDIVAVLYRNICIAGTIVTDVTMVISIGIIQAVITRVESIVIASINFSIGDVCFTRSNITMGLR